MTERKRKIFRTANVRGALLLSVLLAAVVAVAVFISLRIYNQLDNAASVERALSLAQQQLDEIYTTQIEEEAGLRGFVAWNKPFFLDKPTRASRFEVAVSAFESTVAELDIRETRPAIGEMRTLHKLWYDAVAQPLRRNPHAKYGLQEQTLGKVLIDQLGGAVTRTHDLLYQRLQRAQYELKRRINQALIGGLATILVFGLAATVFVTFRARILAVLDRETTIVETLQGAFRTDLDLLPGSRIGTAYLSADRDALVGGDLFDVRRLDRDRGLVIIADISGKGLQAAVNTAFVKYSMRTLALTKNDPAQILAEFNRIFIDTIGDPNLFVVAFVGVLDVSASSLTYASAGHSGAWLRRATDVRQLSVTGPIVGLDASFAYETRTLELERGDLLVLATDGLTEARDDRGDLLEDAGAEALLRAASSEPQEVADALVAAVRKRGGGVVHDDLALLVIAIDGVRERDVAVEAA